MNQAWPFLPMVAPQDRSVRQRLQWWGSRHSARRIQGRSLPRRALWPWLMQLRAAQGGAAQPLNPPLLRHRQDGADGERRERRCAEKEARARRSAFPTS
jgi:hypothetical protein